MSTIRGSDSREKTVRFESESTPASENKKNDGIKNFLLKTIFRRNSSSGKSAASTLDSLQKTALKMNRATFEAKYKVNGKILPSNNIRVPSEKIRCSQESSPLTNFNPRPQKPSTENLRQSIISSVAEHLAKEPTDARRQSSKMTANENYLNDFKTSLDKIFPKNELHVEGKRGKYNNSIKQNPDINDQSSKEEFLKLLKFGYDRLPDTHKAQFYWIAVGAELPDGFRMFKTPLEFMKYEQSSEPAVPRSFPIKNKIADQADKKIDGQIKITPNATSFFPDKNTEKPFANNSSSKAVTGENNDVLDQLLTDLKSMKDSNSSEKNAAVPSDEKPSDIKNTKSLNDSWDDLDFLVKDFESNGQNSKTPKPT